MEEYRLLAEAAQISDYLFQNLVAVGALGVLTVGAMAAGTLYALHVYPFEAFRDDSRNAQRGLETTTSETSKHQR